MEEKNNKSEVKTILFMVFSVVLIGLNGFLTFVDLVMEGWVCQSPSWITGYLMGGAFSIPIIVVLIAMISKNNRNKKKVIEIFFWTSLVVFFLKLMILFNDFVGTLADVSR